MTGSDVTTTTTTQVKSWRPCFNFVRVLVVLVIRVATCMMLIMGRMLGVGGLKIPPVSVNYDLSCFNSQGTWPKAPLGIITGLLLRSRPNSSARDLYPVTTPSPIPHAFLVSQHMWHQRLGHPGGEVLRRLVSFAFISYNKEKPPVLCHAYGTLSRYKARLVANGSTRLEEVDVDETFSPVVKPTTIRTVLNLAASRHWPIHQLNVKNAFLHVDLSETVYMHQPPGFRDSVHPDYIIRSLHHDFAMTDLGPLSYFFGISVTRDSSGLFLSHKKYVVEILDRAHMVNCNPSRTPIDTESKLESDGDPVSDLTLYRSLAGSLQYLTFTRPDISYVVQPVCVYMHDPREPHFSALKRILRYVRGTLDYGLQLFSSSTTDLVAYSDADWVGCPTTRRSTSGYCVFLGNNLLSWSSKRQPTLSHSSAEAEYRGVANVVAETCWLCNLLRELHTLLSFAKLVYCDNVRVLHVPSRYQYADIFTK
uniref:Ribonuclease H-like domain-containing protein n=1 Tax=Tanacetum cinerariifolium TaxID=118510 RepID=A0A699IGK1_TANCI|nr:ribonuclease H-like domain-containing protein [Tanacetum cinerariifolium]